MGLLAEVNIDGYAALATAVGAAVLVPVLNYLNKRANESKSDLKEVISELRASVKRLDEENEELRIRVNHLESLQQELPFPEWSKDRFGRYAWVNASFEMEFLFPVGLTRHDVIGSTDEEVWSKSKEVSLEVISKLVADLRIIDNKALRSAQRRVFCPGFTFLTPDVTYLVCKIPLFRDSVHTGWRGIAMPEVAQVPASKQPQRPAQA